MSHGSTGDPHYPLGACVVASLVTHVAEVPCATRCIGPSGNSALGAIAEANGRWHQLVSVSGVYSAEWATLRFQYLCRGETTAVRVDVYPRGYMEINTNDWHAEDHVTGLLW